MADSTPILDQIAPAQAQKEVTANSVLGAMSGAALFGRHDSACSGRVWGWYGGRWGGSSIANGTSTLTASATVYMVVNRSTGAVTFATTTTDWNNDTTFGRAYLIVVGSSSVTSYEDHRCGPSGILLGGGSSSGTLDIDTLPAASALAGADLYAVSQSGTEGKATHTQLMTAILSLLGDTNGALTANSDLKFATQKAVKTYADGLIAAADAMVFKGVIDCSANPNYPAADRGHTYRVSVAGKIGGASGLNVEAGDLLLCLTDATSAGNQATVGSAWTVAQTNLDGAVIGPVSATDSHFAQFDTTSGKLLKGGIALDTDGALTANSDTRLASQKAVKTYADAIVTGGGINAQTGTTYTVVTGDRGKLVTLSNSSAIAVTLPQAGSTGFSSTWWTALRNIGNGVVTITPTTSTINGAATLVLRRGDSAFVFSDGTNYSIVVTRLASRGVVVLTDGATISVDAGLSDSFRVTLGGNRTLANPTNLVDGQVLNFRILQDGTGSRTLAYDTKYKFAGGTAPVLSTAVSSKDFMSCEYDATDDSLFCSSMKAFA